MIDKQFASFIHSFIKQYKTDVFSNISKCKSLLLDHAKGEYKKEIRLLLQALELSFYSTIINSNDLNFTRISLIKQFQDDYFISEEISRFLIDLLLIELRNYKLDKIKSNVCPVNSGVNKNYTLEKTVVSNIFPISNKVNANPISMISSMLKSGKSPRKDIESKYFDYRDSIYIPAFNDYKKEMKNNNLECEIKTVTQFAIRFNFTFALADDILKWYIGNYCPYYQIMLNSDSLIQTDCLATKYFKKGYDIDNYSKENIKNDLDKIMEEIIAEMKRKKII
jgi:hypothetical protein